MSTEFGAASEGALQRDYERLHAENERLHSKLHEHARELAELKAQFGRYETALSGSKVTVFTQDRDLQYTSISNGLRGLTAAQILGLTDEQLFAGRPGAAMTALKREVMHTGEQRHGEFQLEDAQCHFDLHIEPVRDTAGKVAGVTGVFVDITRRRTTRRICACFCASWYRSKNLLAVIQAMARQTARHAARSTVFCGNLQDGCNRLRRPRFARAGELARRFGGRIGAGTARRLYRSRRPYRIERSRDRAQAGSRAKSELALHELAANAARFGALSQPEGKIAIGWRRADGPRGRFPSL